MTSISLKLFKTLLIVDILMIAAIIIFFDTFVVAGSDVLRVNVVLSIIFNLVIAGYLIRARAVKLKMFEYALKNGYRNDSDDLKNGSI